MYDEVERLERKEAFSADSYYFERNFINPPKEIINIRKVILTEMNIEVKKKHFLKRWEQSLDLILMNLYECIQRNLFLRYGRAEGFIHKVRLNNINKINVNRNTINKLFDELHRLGYIKQHIGFYITENFGKITRVKVLDQLKFLMCFKLDKFFESSFINNNLIRMRDENKNYMNQENIFRSGPYLQTEQEYYEYERNLIKINSQYDNTEIKISIPIRKITDKIIHILENMVSYYLERNHIVLIPKLFYNNLSNLSIIKNICSMVNYIKINNHNTTNPSVHITCSPGEIKKQEISSCNYYKNLWEHESIDFRIVNNLLYRVFKCNLKTGGRFYGAVHQGLPSELRKFITIDGQETVELDYQAFHYRMMYNCKGIDYKDDPFRMKNEDRTLRKHFKKVGVIILNCDGLSTAIGASVKYFKKEAGRLVDGYGVKQLMEAIEERCEEIKGMFYNNKWGSLQYADSKLMEVILLDLRELNIVALPIHDSVIVQKRHKRTLERIMTNRYREFFNFDPIIDCK